MNPLSPQALAYMAGIGLLMTGIVTCAIHYGPRWQAHTVRFLGILGIALGIAATLPLIGGVAIAGGAGVAGIGLIVLAAGDNYYHNRTNSTPSKSASAPSPHERA